MTFTQAILIGIGVAMILEGAIYFAAPESSKKIARSISLAEERNLRLIGAAMIIGGLIFVGALRSC